MDPFRLRDSVGGTPTGATGTVALPKKSLRIGAKNPILKKLWRGWPVWAMLGQFFLL